MNLEEQIKTDIKNNPIILYLKGTKTMPMCGFSSTVVNILNAYTNCIQSFDAIEIHYQINKF